MLDQIFRIEHCNIFTVGDITGYLLRQAGTTQFLFLSPDLGMMTEKNENTLVKILLVTHLFPPKHNAGTENYALGLSKTLLNRGHDVYVLCAEDWESGQDYWNGVVKDVYEGVTVYRIHLNWTKADNPNQVLYNSWAIETWLESFLDELRPDVVHVVSVVTLGLGVLRSVRRIGISLLLTLTDFWFICPSIQLLRSDGSLCTGKTTAWECQLCLSASSRLMQVSNKVLPESVRSWVWGNISKFPLLTRHRGLRGILLNMEERKQMLTDALTFPDRVFAPSKFVQQIFAENRSVRVEVLYHGHDLDWRKKYNGKTDSNKLRFGYIGQIQEIKGVHVLIEAFQRANISSIAELNIWGGLEKDLNYSGKLKMLIEDDPSISLCGRFERDNLAEVLSKVDVLVVPSLWYENAPLVIQEAFATQTPVIATNLGGMAEMVQHDVNGLLFERGNAVDLARQFQRLIDEPSLLERLKTGIPNVKTSKEEAEELEKIYSELAQVDKSRER